MERFHKTLRREFLDGKVFDSVEDAQRQLDAWVREYNFERPHQSLGMAVPWERFRLANNVLQVEVDPAAIADAEVLADGATRRVNDKGHFSFAGVRYRAAIWLAGEEVVVVCDGGLVHVHHRGVLIATHARRHSADKQTEALRRGQRAAAPRRPSSVTAPSVTRKVDSSGHVSFAGTSYLVGLKYKRRQVQVAVVGDVVEIAIGEELIRSHRVRHDRTREHGALANPGGRPHRINAAL